MRPVARRAFERAFRAASVALNAPERRALDLAREIFDVAAEMAPVTDDPLPLEMRAPLTYLGQKAVPGILPAAQLPTDDPDTALDVIAYLTEGYASMFVEFDRDHFDQWRRTRDRAAGQMGLCLACRRPREEHRVEPLHEVGASSGELRGVVVCADGREAAFPEERIDDAQQ